ncbi:hypothetical protein GXW82_36530 [Streptacidiphilus sp. 4-A2]|nr:hypothetical protein [Streptacidiphilus sp. 4-A2]
MGQDHHPPGHDLQQPDRHPLRPARRRHPSADRLGHGGPERQPQCLVQADQQHLVQRHLRGRLPVRPAGADHYAVDQAAVQAAQSGYYGTLPGTVYRVYHHTVRPVLSATVAPDKSGQCVDFTVQEDYSGSWRTVVSSGCEKIGSTGTARDTLTLGNATGHLYRFAAEYVHSAADTSNANTSSAWQYFAVRN